MRPLTQARKDEIFHFFATTGLSDRKIASRTGLSCTKVSSLHKEFDPNKENHPGGRPPKLSEADSRKLVREFTTGKQTKATEATRQLNQTLDQPIHPQTTRNRLRAAGKVARSKKNWPALKAHHPKLRLQFAREHKDWTVDDWKRVIYSDETKINFVNSDGQEYVWVNKGAPFTQAEAKPKEKYGGGGFMVWGCMSWDGVGRLVEVEGAMDSVQYCQILEEGLLPCMEENTLDASQLKLQSDNDSKHNSKYTQKWLTEHGIVEIKWPPNSPDLNPIEHLWFILKRRLNKWVEQPKGVHELWERLEKAWADIKEEEVRKLIESMPRRMAAVIKAKGGNTKY